MPRHFSESEVLDLIIGIILGGRGPGGAGAGGGNPFLDIPTLGGAIDQDRARLQEAARQIHQAQGSSDYARGDLIRALQGEMEKTQKKKKPKVGRYQREVGKALKQLKKKHPRTAQAGLMKKAHRLVKAKRKREGW